ncbi:hypothetical protein AWRI1631_110550 [Saccharomyces cerevisiae AWRI1631]|uniref:Uncharacterized protein n=1 Tax=Saccharomyces cerevisiae (strain AWRI1631) TaxID=545124 RepID=B5VLZ2_YEAS6|nr:hypothetical protein AWRI1631_110550 [Saccharomyces cerevisiae AWRI1631]
MSLLKKKARKRKSKKKNKTFHCQTWNLILMQMSFHIIN